MPTAPLFDLTVRVGCSLAYEVTGTAMLLLNLQPLPERNHAVVFQALSLGDNLPAEKFTDSHGNQVWRVKLATTHWRSVERVAMNGWMSKKWMMQPMPGSSKPSVNIMQFTST